MTKYLEIFRWALAERRRLAWGGVALLATNALSYAVPALLGASIDRLRSGRAVTMLCLAVFGAAILQACARVASRLLIFNAARDIEQNMRERVFAHVMSLAPRDLAGFTVGDLQSRLTSDLMAVRLLFGAGLLNFVNTTVAYLCALPMLIWYGGSLAAIALMPYPFLIWAMRRLARRIFTASAEGQKRLGALTNFVSESLGARLFIIASAWFEVENRRFDKHNRGNVEANLRAARTRTVFGPLGSSVGALSVGLVLWFGGQRVIDGRMSLGELVAFNAYLGMLALPTLMLGFMIALGQRGLASYARVREVLDTVPWQGGEKRLGPVFSLELEDISVRRGQRVVLHDVSLRVEAHEWLGVVGEVGSGKSTLLSVLSRLELPEKGHVRIAGDDAAALSFDTLRTHIALVPQQPFLFSSSIIDNVACGRDVPLEEIERALEWAAVLDEMKRLPEGLETVIGERGVTLSGGQRQRVVLARALVGEPRALLLDDCLSAVDSDTERRIIAALLALPFKPAVVMASHRLAVFERIRQIAVLAEGRVIERGSPAELLERNGIYATLYRRQRLREQLERLAS